MVASPNYERLKTFMEAARANEGLNAWDPDYKQALRGFDEAVDSLNAYRVSHGFTGVTGDAMDEWVDASIRRITQYKAGYERGYQSYLNGRDIMATALSEAEKLSPSLIDAETEAMRDDWFVSVPDSKPGGGLEFMGRRYTTGAAYVEAVEAQANAQREAAAARILSMLNSRTKAVSEKLRLRPATPEARKSLTEFENEQSSSGGGITSWGYSASDDYGRAADRSSGSSNYPGGFDQPWWSEADAAAARNRVVSSGAVPTQEPAYGETGSRTNPITDPQELMGTDLLHTRVNGTTYRNGVVGGHTPAPPADADHPLWRLNGGPASDSAAAGRLGGVGVLGAGALGLRGAAQRVWTLRRRGHEWSGRVQLGQWPVRCRSHGRRRHARRHWLNQRFGCFGGSRSKGRLLLRFGLRFLYSPRGHSWRWWRERCRRIPGRHGHHGCERWRCGRSCWCCWQGRHDERRLHGSRCGSGCWRGQGG